MRTIFSAILPPQPTGWQSFFLMSAAILLPATVVLLWALLSKKKRRRKRKIRGTPATLATTGGLPPVRTDGKNPPPTS